MYFVYIEYMYCLYIGLEHQPLTEGATEWQQTGELISVHQMPLPTHVCVVCFAHKQVDRAIIDYKRHCVQCLV